MTQAMLYGDCRCPQMTQAMLYGDWASNWVGTTEEATPWLFSLVFFFYYYASNPFSFTTFG
jgi:hypothetical protein